MISKDLLIIKARGLGKTVAINEIVKTRQMKSHKKNLRSSSKKIRRIVKEQRKISSENRRNDSKFDRELYRKFGV